MERSDENALEENDDLSPLETLNQQHRKEKKDLQARVQGLKNSANKSKKAKKEILVEIASLTAELDAKHELELLNLDNDTTTDSQDAINSDPSNMPNSTADQSVDVAVQQSTSGKLSKAQKRRQKKEAERREQAERVTAAEHEALLGPRHQETVRIRELLRESGLRLREVPADGNCLYAAVGHQTRVPPPDLRSLAAAYIRDHRDEFLPYMTGDTGDVMSEEEFANYCAEVRRDGVWGGDLELRALSHALRRKIRVVQAEGDVPLVFGDDVGSEGGDGDGEEEHQPITLTYHRHVVTLGEHYNSVDAADTDDPNEDGDS